MIDPSVYQTLSDTIETILVASFNAEAQIPDLTTKLAYLDTAFNVDIAIMSSDLIDLNDGITDDVSSSSTINKIVSSLEFLALSQTMYTDINDFLSFNLIKVGELFAARSERVGYPISHSHIK
jgi:hypothetical protein